MQNGRARWPRPPPRLFGSRPWLWSIGISRLTVMRPSGTPTSTWFQDSGLSSGCGSHRADDTARRRAVFEHRQFEPVRVRASPFVDKTMPRAASASDTGSRRTRYFKVKTRCGISFSAETRAVTRRWPSPGSPRSSLHVPDYFSYLQRKSKSFPRPRTRTRIIRSSRSPSRRDAAFEMARVRRRSQTAIDRTIA